MKSKLEIKLHHIYIYLEELLDAYVARPIDNVRIYIINTIQGFKNIYTFWKVIFRFRWWTSHDLYAIMIKAIVLIEVGQKKYSHTTPKYLRPKLKTLQMCRVALERIVADDYDSLHRDRLYGGEVFKLKSIPCAWDEYGDPTMYRMEFPERTPERKRSTKAHQDLETYLKKQDFEMFCKAFKQSESWWD